MSSSFGFATIALGKHDYLEMAVDMVLSLREFHGDPVSLLCCTKLADQASDLYRDVFDDILPLNDHIVAMPASRFLLADRVTYDSCFFIDADVLVLNTLDDHIAETKRKPISLIGSFLSAGSGQRHHGIDVDELIRSFGLDRYFTNHAGAFGYSREFAAGFFRECAEVYAELYRFKWRRKGFIGNELAFGVVNGRRGIAPMELEFPVIWPDEMGELTPGVSAKPLLHFIDMPPENVFDELMARVALRRRARALPTHSTEFWRRKGLKSQRAQQKVAQPLRRHLLGLSAGILR